MMETNMSVSARKALEGKGSVARQPFPPAACAPFAHGSAHGVAVVGARRLGTAPLRFLAPVLQRMRASGCPVRLLCPAAAVVPSP